jgi:hypothetical protein
MPATGGTGGSIGGSGGAGAGGSACVKPLADCNQIAGDGCEVDLSSDPSNCGYCGKVCDPAGDCSGGVCYCAADVYTAKPVPLDLALMMDQSGSMSEDDASGTSTKWDSVTSALKAFMADDGSVGLGLGLQYFPLPASGAGMVPTTCTTDLDCGQYGPCFPGGFFCSFIGCTCQNSAGTGDSCVAGDYATLEVPIAPLPGVAMTISDSFAAHSPGGSTPTAPALQGILDAAKAWKTSHPDREVVAVMATDGTPTECEPQDIPGIADYAAKAYSGSPSIRTFVIGVGSDLSSLNAIAQAGGTDQAYLVDSSSVVQDFIDAMKTIQGKAFSCEYTIPAPAAGTADLSKLNVQYVPGGTGTPVAFTKVSAAACTSSGWHYDDDVQPSRIILCPDACTGVKADPAAVVEVLIGCRTVE